jgi:hypothetical protein
LLFLLIASSKVPTSKKLHKQKKIRPIHQKGSDIVAVRYGTIVTSNVDKTHNGHKDTYHHLRYLKRRDNHGPWRTDLDGHEEVIKVHDGMDTIIHLDKENARRRMVDVGMPAVE